MYQPDLSPLAGSLGLSALAAVLPLLTLFALLGWARAKAHWAGLAALAMAIGVAVACYGMPGKLALLATGEGAAFGLFPIGWILVTAIWLHQLTVVSGAFDEVRHAFRLISDDVRIQAVVVAFCFGGLLEALAGFGAPVAITGVMIMALGFSPLRAAITALVANTAPVAFGAMGLPILTAGRLTEIPGAEIGAYVGRQTPLIALIVPLLLLLLVDGARGLREVWPVALVCGAAFGAAQYASSSYISVELTDIVASLAALAAVVLFLRVWRPARAPRTGLGSDGPAHPAGQPWRSASVGGRHADRGRRPYAAGPSTNGRATLAGPTPGPAPASPLDRARLLRAFTPYLVVVAVFSVAKLSDGVERALAAADTPIPWPGLDGNILTAAGRPSTATVYTVSWLSSPGTLLLLSGILIALLQRIELATAVREFTATVLRLRRALLTVAAVLALAYVMNLSGQTLTIGAWVAGVGGAIAFLAPVLGWFGVAVTGSDTSSNALFATLQQAAAQRAGIDPSLLVAANASGGVLGKMISPQNLTIAATAVGLVDREADLLRAVLKWSLALLLVLCVLVGLQAGALSWLLP